MCVYIDNVCLCVDECVYECVHECVHECVYKEWTCTHIQRVNLCINAVCVCI